MTTLYLAGPMRGIKDFNVEAFDAAAAWLRECGYLVMNPCDKDRADFGDDVFKSETGDLKDIAHIGFDLATALAWDLDYIAKQADGIALLPGWENSSGARAEKACAEALGKKVWFLSHDSNAGQWSLTPVDVSKVSPKFSLPPRKDPFEAMWVRPTDMPKYDPLGILDHKGEVRVTSATGGQKGAKPSRMSLIPGEFEEALGEVFGAGAKKYDDHNYRKGYNWSLSYDAMRRHLSAFWRGEDRDPETGLPHIVHAAWHCSTLHYFSLYPDRYGRFDDRYRKET